MAAKSVRRRVYAHLAVNTRNTAVTFSCRATKRVKNDQQLLRAIRRGVSDWAHQTVYGQRTYLARHCFLPMRMLPELLEHAPLRSRLRKAGIEDLRVTERTLAENWHGLSDMVLVRPPEE